MQSAALSRRRFPGPRTSLSPRSVANLTRSLSCVTDDQIAIAQLTAVIYLTETQLAAAIELGLRPALYEWSAELMGVRDEIAESWAKLQKKYTSKPLARQGGDPYDGAGKPKKVGNRQYPH